MATEQQNFDRLIDNVYQTHYALQENAKKIINQNLTIRNWLVGCYIVEYEQRGEDRAEYGTRILEEMAKVLKLKGVKGLRRRELQLCRKFYLVYPQIWRTVSAKLQTANNKHINAAIANSQEIWRTVSAKLENKMEIAPELLLSKLSYSHFIELIKIDDSLQRLFYEVEAIKNNWSVRELERAIDTSLALRTTLSTNKEAVIAKIKNLKPENNIDVIRNPFILEFLGLEEKSEYNETDLEQAILTHLQKFLTELGTGFCFEARQKRITIDNINYRIDLVFYHRILKCHVLIDLKMSKFTPSDAGQMSFYLNYYEGEEMTEGDNPPIGIILCASKDNTLVKYTTADKYNQLFVSKYLLELPDKELLEDFIKKEIER